MPGEKGWWYSKGLKGHQVHLEADDTTGPIGQSPKPPRFGFKVLVFVRLSLTVGVTLLEMQ